MAASTSENGTAIRYKVMASTSGTTAESMKEAGLTTTCTAKEPTLIPMAANTSATTTMTKEMATASSGTQMADSSKVSGLMDSNTEKASSFCQAANKEKANGNTAKE